MGFLNSAAGCFRKIQATSLVLSILNCICKMAYRLGAPQADLARDDIK
jgi:hypothetical protein